MATATVAQNQILTPERKLRFVEQIIENYYVDTVNADHIVEEAINAMLGALDPHSSYSNPEDTKALTEPLQGNFSGIGIQFNMLTDTLYVIQTVAGGPSERVGILAGDRIMSANDTVISGVKMPTADVMKILRGPKGSEVAVKVLRKGVADPIEFRIVRDDIPIYSVDAYYMADPTTGYIRVSRFAESTSDEVAEAIGELRKKGMRNLVLDLEDNGGGYLRAAYEVAGMFLDNNDLIVYTEGMRQSPYYYRNERKGILPEGRLVITVNQYSASASEIVSGAIQDNDRGVIVGRRTFGKGLVQRPFPLPDGSLVRLTTARYYTPAGRSIQKPYTAGEGDEYREDMRHRYESGEFMSADSVHFADSLRYSTLKLKRPVYGGGGIMPDKFVGIDTTFYSDYYRDLVAKGVLNRYCVDYVDKYRKELTELFKTDDAFIAGFDVTDEMMQGVIDLGTKDGVEFKEDQYKVSEPFMRTIVKALIGRDLYAQSTYYRVANELNPIYREAMRVIRDKKTYDSVLGS